MVTLAGVEDMVQRGLVLQPGQVEVVGVSGKAQAGKSFLSRHIIRPMGFSPWALATPLKSEAVARYGAPADEVFGIDGKGKSDKVRQLLQRLGTEEGRDKYGEDIWLKYAECFMLMQLELGQNRFVIPDVRFPNEAEWIKGLGGKVYRLLGRGGLQGEAAQHASETSLDTYKGFDKVFDNSPGKERYVLTGLRVQLYSDFKMFQ